MSALQCPPVRRADTQVGPYMSPTSGPADGPADENLELAGDEDNSR